MRKTAHLARWTALCAAAAVLLFMAGDRISAQGRGGKGKGKGKGKAAAQEVPRGLRVKTDGASPGYVLFAPLQSDTTFMIDNDGEVVKTWKSGYIPSGWFYFLDNGHLMRGGSEENAAGLRGGGAGGRLQEFDWDGNLVWDYSYNSPQHLPHHDVAILPNGHVLAIAWERKTPGEARAIGRRDDLIPEEGVWPDTLIEFEPLRPNGARVVWEWHVWDHLIQHVDPNLPNYADPSDHPERVDINGDDPARRPQPPANPPTDIFHTNAVDYNAELDQVIVSSPNFDELWVIDHSTTSEEAAGSTGGRSGKGGDLLYRWGNPQTYGRGGPEDQKFGFEHHTHWIAPGLPGAGHIGVFSNRAPGPDGPYTRLFELVPPVDAQGRYTLPAEGPYGPAEPVWSYSDPPTFNATYISGFQRLANGNTLVNSGPQGRFFEITPAGEIVWEYWSRYTGNRQTAGGSPNPYAVFRALKIPPDHPGLAGRALQPLDPQPPLVSPLE